MKTAALILFATAALARPGAVDRNPSPCPAPNGNFCVGTDIILRCDANGVGTPGRCSDNVAGYPPAGGIASCWESKNDAGDAACEKNCVVYADPPFTLGSDECQPSYTASSTGYGSPTSSSCPTTTGYVPPPSTYVPPTSSPAGYPTTTAYPTTTGYAPTSTGGGGGYPTETPTTYPATSFYTTITETPPPNTSQYPGGAISSIVTYPNNSTVAPTGNPTTNVPVPPSGSPPPAVPGAAPANRAGGVLAVAGFMAAMLL